MNRIREYVDIINLQNNGECDEYQKGLSKKWIYDFEISGNLIRIVSKDKNELTHWGELSFECSGKKLSIYPDGGLLNGWILSRNNTQFLDRDNTDADSDILLERSQNIKVDITNVNI